MTSEVGEAITIATEELPSDLDDTDEEKRRHRFLDQGNRAAARSGACWTSRQLESVYAVDHRSCSFAGSIRGGQLPRR